MSANIARKMTIYIYKTKLQYMLDICLHVNISNLNMSMYKSWRHNDPLIWVDEPLNVSVSVEVGGVVSP